MRFKEIPKNGNLKKLIMMKKKPYRWAIILKVLFRHSLSEGRFKNASEVVRAGLRLLEGDENRLLI